jgi:hypothetical protein
LKCLEVSTACNNTSGEIQAFSCFFLSLSFDRTDFLQEQTGRFWDGITFFFKQRLLAGKSETLIKSLGKRPLGRPRHRWEDTGMDLRETGCKGVDWMHLTQDRDQQQALVNMVMNHQVP